MIYVSQRQHYHGEPNKLVVDELSLEGWEYATKCRVEGVRNHRKTQVLETEGKDCLYRQFGGYSEEKQPYQKGYELRLFKKKMPLFIRTDKSNRYHYSGTKM